MPTFQSAFLKIRRAESQAKDLGGEINKFFSSSNGRAYGIIFERNADARQWRAIFRVLKQLPDEWPVALGEIIHNLRSALDHLVYEASAPDENGVPLTRTEYPIFADETEYRKSGPRKIRGLNDATRAFVELHQPFMNRKPKTISPLWLLHQLSNTDKHRELNVIVRAHPLTRIEALIKPTRTPLSEGHIVTQVTIINDALLEDGAEY